MYRFYLRSRDTTQSYSSWVAANTVIAIDISKPPQTVTFSAYGPLQLRASWLPPADLGGASQILYDVWIDGGSLMANAWKDLTYLTPPLPAGSSHSCVIRAVNDAGYSDWSMSATATALLLPSTPQSVSVSVSGALSLLLQFSSPAQTGLSDQSWPISTYEILVGSSNQNEKIASVVVSGSAPQISVPFGNLTKGNTYSFAVRASNAAGFGSFSALVSAMALSQAQPPFQMSVAQGLSRQIRITWQMPLDVGDYTRNSAKVFYYSIVITSSCDGSVGPAPNMSSAIISKFQTTSTSYLVSALIPDQCVTCQVAAVTLVGPGAFATQQFTPRILPLSNARVSFSSTVTGDTIKMNVSFIISSYIGQYDMIGVQFPKNFSVDAASLMSPIIGGLDGTAYLQLGSYFVCGQECSPQSPSLLVSRVGISSAGPGTAVSFTVTGIVNRHWSGPSGSFQIKTLTMTDSIQAIDMALNVSGTFLYPGTMPALVALGDLRAGIVTSATLTFAPSDRNSIPGSFQLLFTLGPQMTFLDSVSLGASSTAPMIDGSITYKRVGSNQIILNIVSGSSIPSGSYRSVIFYGVRNQLHSGDSGFFGVRVMTLAGDAVDENGMISSSNIVAGVLTNVAVEISIPQSFALNTFNFTFMTGAVGLPRDAAVRIFLPYCYDASRSSLLAFRANGLNIPAQILRGTVSSQLDLTVQGTIDIASQTYVNIILSSIRNCYANTQIPSSLRYYFVIQTFWTRDGGLSLIEQSGNIPEVDVRPSPLTVTVKGSSYLTGGQGNLSFSLTTTSSFVNAQSDGGLLIINFPEGFVLTGDPSPALTSSFFSNGFQISGIQGFVVASCLKQTWMQCSTLYLALLDAQSWPFGVTVNLVLQNVQNRALSGPTGPFNITSASRGGRVYDQDNAFQLNLQPNSLKQATVRATPPYVGIVGPASLFIMCTNVIPPNSSIKVDFPQDFTFTSTMYISNQSCDGTFTVSQQTIPLYVKRPNGLSSLEQTGNITIFRTGGQVLPPGTQIVLKLEGLKRRSSSGSTGLFSIHVLFKSILIEEGFAPPDYFFYQPPLLFSSSPVNSPAAGGVNVTVTGLNFGILDRNPNLINTNVKQRKQTALMWTSCQSTAWTSDSVLVSLLASGTLSTLALAVSVESQTGSILSVISFQTLTVSAVSTRNSPQSGSQSIVTIHGRDHGTYDSSLAARIYSCHMATAWIADTSTRSIASSGFGSTYFVGLTLGTLSGTATTSGSYDLPVVSATARAGLSLFANLCGIFSFNGLSTSATIGLSAAEQTVWTSSSAVIAIASRGLRMSHLAGMSIGVRLGSVSQVFSYSIAAVTDASNGNIAANAVMMVSLWGAGIGNYGLSQTQRLGGSNCEQSRWLSDSSVYALFADGSKRSQSISLTSGIGVGTVQNKLLSFNTPFLSSISASKNIVNGIDSLVLLFATDLGNAEISSRERTGMSAAERSRWKSDSSISALSSDGYSGSLSFIVTSAVSSGTVSSVISFNVPGIITSLFTNVVSNHVSPVTIWSSGLGTAGNSISSRMGGTVLEKSKWASDTTILGYAASGLQRTNPICVTAQRAVGSTSSLVSYASPQLLSMLQPNIGKPKVIFAVGSNMGTLSYSMSSRPGLSSAQQTYWTSDTVVGFLSSQGLQGSRTGIVTCGAYVGSLSSVLSYDLPRITFLPSVNIGQESKVALRMLGTGAGTAQYSVAYRIGASNSERTFWLSDSSVYGRPANRVGSGLSLYLKVTAGIVKNTAPYMITFDSALLYSASNGNIGLASDSFLLLNMSIGRGGNVFSSSALRLGQSAASLTSWKSDSSVICKPIASVQSSMRLSTSIGGRASTTTRAFTFDTFSNLRIGSSQTTLKYRILGINIINRTEGCDNGTVITATPDTGFLAIVTNVDVNGSFLSIYTTSVGDVSDAPLSVVISPANQSSTTNLDGCTCNGQNLTILKPFSSCLALTTETFADSRISIIDFGGAGPTSGLISQLSLGVMNSAAMRFGGSACSSSLWLSSSAVQCKSLGRMIMARQFSLSVSKLVASFSREFVYESLLNLSPGNSRTKGNINVSFSGSGFGIATSSSRGRLGLTACLESRWFSDTILTCRSRLGTYSALSAVITIQGSAVGTLTSSFSYDNPQFFAANARNISDTKVTITGVNFGLYDASFSASIADLGCASTTWISETSLGCQLSAGVTANQVSSAAVSQGRLCSRCKSSEVLLGCDKNSVGICRDCQGCPPGAFRMNCVPGERYSRCDELLNICLKLIFL